MLSLLFPPPDDDPRFTTSSMVSDTVLYRPFPKDLSEEVSPISLFHRRACPGAETTTWKTGGRQTTTTTGHISNKMTSERYTFIYSGRIWEQVDDMVPLVPSRGRWSDHPTADPWTQYWSLMMVMIMIMIKDIYNGWKTYKHMPTCSSFHRESFHLLGPLSDGEPAVILLPNLAWVVGQFAGLIEDDELVVFLLDISDHCGHFNTNSTCHHAWQMVRKCQGGLPG